MKYKKGDKIIHKDYIAMNNIVTVSDVISGTYFLTSSKFVDGAPIAAYYVDIDRVFIPYKAKVKTNHLPNWW